MSKLQEKQHTCTLVIFVHVGKSGNKMGKKEISEVISENTQLFGTSTELENRNTLKEYQLCLLEPVFSKKNKNLFKFQFSLSTQLGLKFLGQSQCVDKRQQNEDLRFQILQILSCAQESRAIPKQVSLQTESGFVKSSYVGRS